MFFQRLTNKLYQPFRDQSPAARLIRQTARKEWKLIVITFSSSLLQAVGEGLTLGVMFLAVQVLSSANGEALGQTLKPIERALPILGRTLSNISTFQAFTLLISIAVGLKLIQGLAMYVGSISSGYFASRVSRELTCRLHRQIMNYTYACASRYRIGELQYITGMTPNSVVTQISSYNSLITTVLMLCTYLAVLIRLSPWLLVAAFLLGLVSTLIQKTLLPRVQKRATIGTELGTNLASRMTENIQGLRLLHTTGYLAEAANDVDQQAIKSEFNTRGQIRLMSINAPVSIVLPIAMITIIAWLSVLVFGQRSTGILPSLVTFVVALQRLNGSIVGISDIFLKLKNNSALLNILNDFLIPSDKEFRRMKGLTFKAFNHEIRLRDVSLSYSKDLGPSLQSINLTIPHGHTVALVGSSGAGKSSIADLLAGIYEPSSGQILIDDLDIQDIDPTSWQKRIGVVSQDTFLFNASIADNISFGTPTATASGVREAARKAQAAAFIEKLPDGYNTLVGERGYKLSGGQRQRISLARAILRDPDLLILDEATSALDTESERLVQEAIDQFERKHSILVIAHRLSTIVNADCIYVLDHGRIIEQGNHRELLKQNGRYARLWQQQVKVNNRSTIALES